MTGLRFDGQVALVTGAGRGIGRGHALELARRGARVVVNDPGGSVDGGAGEHEDPASSVVAEIRAAGGQAITSRDSVVTAAGGAAMVEQALREFGQLNIVVHNAGILGDKSFGNMTPEVTDPVLDVHLRGAFHVLVPAWRHMKERGYGRIVTTTSASGLFGNFGQANYGAAKAGLIGLTRVLAVEGRRIGIHVNAVAPAAATRMNADMLGERNVARVPDFRPGQIGALEVALEPAHRHEHARCHAGHRRLHPLQPRRGAGQVRPRRDVACARRAAPAVV